MFPKILLAEPVWFRKITTDSHILAHVDVLCPDDGHPKLKINVSKLILDSYEYEVKERVELYLYSLSEPSWPVIG
jgi:hypothetical protein